MERANPIKCNLSLNVRPSDDLLIAQLNLFTGWKDPPLTEKGRGEALECAIKLRNAGCTHYDIAFTSTLTRARQTLGIILKEIGQEIKTYEVCLS